MKVTKTGNGYVITPEPDDSTESMLVTAIKLYLGDENDVELQNSSVPLQQGLLKQSNDSNVDTKV